MSKLKVLGLAFVAVLAIAAVSAPAASATEFHSETAHTLLSGSQIGAGDVFHINAGTVTCKKATYNGTISVATTKIIAVAPTYSECTAFGFVNATINPNGCEYEFTTQTDGTDSVYIDCPVGHTIVVTAHNCEVTVPTQTIKGGITYATEGAGATRAVTAKFNLTGITYTQHAKLFPYCNTTGTGPETTEFHDGRYKGGATIIGTKTEGVHVGIWKTPL